MSEPNPELARAIELMAEALRLLDECGQATAAAHLQQAHDVAVRGAAAVQEAEVDEAGDEADLALDRTAIRALGGTFAVLAAVLGRANVIPMRELADILAIYAATTGETDHRQGVLIACWANILREAAEHSGKS